MLANSKLNIDEDGILENDDLATKIRNGYKNQDEKTLMKIDKWIKKNKISWIADKDFACLAIVQSDTHIGIYVDMAGGFGMGGLPLVFERKNPVKISKQKEFEKEETKEVENKDQEKTDNVIHVDFVSKKRVA